LKPNRPFLLAAGDACRRGWLAAVANLPSIIALEATMAAVVAAYYLWAPAGAILSRYAQWQASGGMLGAGLVFSLAGGALSEISLVYFQQRGRWNLSNVESLVFKFVIFYVIGCTVFQFYRLQAFWWGTGTTLSVIVPKVIVDQFGYTVLFAAPYYALLTRWHTLGYSGKRLWRELNADFITERFLPILVTNWMFWIPAISFVYAMPPQLQPPLSAFAMAIWGLLVTALGSQKSEHPVVAPEIAPDNLPEELPDAEPAE